MAISNHSESIIGGGEMRSEVITQGTDPKDLAKDHSSEKFQPSIFSLTLDEIQTKSGMDFGAINMDEFLNTVVSSDDFQISSIVEQGPPNISVPTPLSGKTIEEIWSGLQDNSQADQNQGGFEFSRPMARNETLGEMTLEEFLIAAGVIRPPSPHPLPIDLNNNPSVGSFFSNGGLCMNMNNMGVNVGPVMIGCETSTRASCVNGNGINTLMSDGSSAFNSPLNLVEAGYNNKRKQDPAMDTAAAKQRYKRMLKNRESAARSRARKQAYTWELEKQLKRHKAENAELEKQLKRHKVENAELEKQLKRHKVENARLKLAMEESEKKFKKEGGEKDSEMKGSFGSLRKTKSAAW